MLAGFGLGGAIGVFHEELLDAGRDTIDFVSNKKKQFGVWRQEQKEAEEERERNISTWDARRIRDFTILALRGVKDATSEHDDFWKHLTAHVTVLASVRDNEVDRLLAERLKNMTRIEKLKSNTLAFDGVSYTSHVDKSLTSLEAMLAKINSLLALTVLMLNDTCGVVYDIETDLASAKDFAEERRDALVNDFRLLLDEIELAIGASSARAENEILRHSDEQMRMLTTGELGAAHAYDEINVLLGRFGVEPIQTPAELDLQRLRDAAAATEANREADVIRIDGGKAKEQVGS